MDLSKLTPRPGSRQKKVRVGRGESSGLGKTCGRGGKGQTARAGGGVRAGFEGGQMPLYRRIPKLGFVSRQRVLGSNRFQVVNLSVLDKFENGAVVDAESLCKLGYAKSLGKQAGIKVLGSGNLTKKLTVKVEAVSDSAKAKIESLGGKVEIIAPKAAE